MERNTEDNEDEDSVEAELAELVGGDHQSDNVEGLEIYILTCLTVQRYEGETCAGQFHGEGLAYFEGGHMYKGMFSKGLMDGSGLFIHADGLKYEGELACNLPMGQGIYTWPDGSTYEGEVYNCLRHGIGTFKSLKNSVVYTGQWGFGKRHGKGAIYYNKEKTSWYKGDWVMNRKEGWGVRCYPSGNIYSGEWRNNLRHGEGTMRWMNLRQQYVGTWHNGVQHGRGTHFWNLSQGDELHFFLNSHYTGEFVQGQRHGEGRICFASGASYDGEWQNNESHSTGKFTSADGRVFEGDLVYDQIMAYCLNSSKGLHPLSDMTLNIQHLLAMIPARARDTEYQQVELAVLMYGAELRSIYRFYRRLGRSQSPYSMFLLTRLQLWRLLKDCHIHHHFTLSQTDQFIRGEDEATVTDVHSPFTPIFLRQLLSFLVVVAYHIYHKVLVSEMSLLADCFTKLMTENILPNARCVKGFVFRQPYYAAIAVNHLQKCWKIYKNYCKSSRTTKDDQTMTCRDLLWMFQGLNLLDNNLTTARLMKIITAERPDPTNLTSCLDEEVPVLLPRLFGIAQLPFSTLLPSQIIFLEFFEVLFGCAEIFLQVSEGPDARPLSSPETEVRGDLSDKNSKQTESLSDRTGLPTCQDEKSEEDLTVGESQPTEHLKLSPQPTKEHGHDKKRVLKTQEDKVKGCEMQQKIGTINQFFDQHLFPAFKRKYQPHPKRPLSSARDIKSSHESQWW